MRAKRDQSGVMRRVVQMVSNNLKEAEGRLNRRRTTEPAYERGRADEAGAILNALKEMAK